MITIDQAVSRLITVLPHSFWEQRAIAISWVAGNTLIWQNRPTILLDEWEVRRYVAEEWEARAGRTMADWRRTALHSPGN